eukprot:1190283-Prorocentrum_minimum.AAC.2
MSSVLRALSMFVSCATQPLLDLYPSIKTKIRGMMEVREQSYHNARPRAVRECDVFLTLTHNDVGEVVKIDYEAPESHYMNCDTRIRQMAQEVSRPARPPSQPLQTKPPSHPGASCGTWTSPRN